MNSFVNHLLALVIPDLMLQSVASVLRTYHHPLDVLRNFWWHAWASVSNRPVVFVVGAPRSGTTLLQVILSNHPHFSSVASETALFSSWQNLFSRDLYGLPPEQLRVLRAESKDVVDYFDRFVRAVTADCPTKTFVEKTPQHVLQTAFLLRHFPQGRVVHLLRDGRDCYVSARQVSSIPQARSLHVYAKYWARCTRTGLRFRGHPRVWRLRYEDLVSQPRLTLQELMRFLREAVSESQFDPALRAADPRAQAEIFGRLGEPITAQTVGQWRTELSPAEIRQFEQIAKRELIDAGYSLGAL